MDFLSRTAFSGQALCREPDACCDHGDVSLQRALRTTVGVVKVRADQAQSLMLWWMVAPRNSRVVGCHRLRPLCRYWSVADLKVLGSGEIVVSCLRRRVVLIVLRSPLVGRAVV